MLQIMLPVKHTVKSSPDGGSSSEAVLLALVHGEGGHDAPLLQAIEHDLRLVRRHHLVL